MVECPYTKSRSSLEYVLLYCYGIFCRRLDYILTILHSQWLNETSRAQFNLIVLFYFSLLTPNLLHIYLHIWSLKRKRKVDLRGIEPRISEERHGNSQRGCLHKLGALTIGPQVLRRNSDVVSQPYKSDHTITLSYMSLYVVHECPINDQWQYPSTCLF